MIESLKAKHINQEELISLWREDPVQAAKDICGARLAPSQQISLVGRFKHSTQIDVMGRGQGKTYLDALTAVLKAVLYPGHQVGIIGPSFRQAKFVFAEIEKLYFKSPLLQEACMRSPVYAADSCRLTFHAAPGKNSSFIEALPLGVDGAKSRGARYHTAIADEGAQIDDTLLNRVVRGFLATNNDIWERVDMVAAQREKIKAGLMSENDLVIPAGNQLIITSTAFYQYNHLWRRVNSLIQQILKGYYESQRNGSGLDKFWLKGGPLNNGQIPFRSMSDGKLGVNAFRWQDMPEAFMNVESIQQAKLEMSEYEFLMEYESYFPSDSEGFFRRHLLDKCREHCQFSCLEGPRKGNFAYVLGVDPARSGDNFAIAVWEIDLDTGLYSLVRVYAWNNKDFTRMHFEIRSLLKHWNAEYMEMDAGGGGTTIRDLLASEELCPPGDRLILERDFDGHRLLVGDRKLGKLIQFANYEWVHDTNFGLLSAMQHGQVRIASNPNMVTEVWTPKAEEMDAEMEEALKEISSIVVSPAGQRMRWDTPTEKQRKDRYSAVLIGFSAARKVAERRTKKTSLALGGWA